MIGDCSDGAAPTDDVDDEDRARYESFADDMAVAGIHVGLALAGHEPTCPTCGERWPCAAGRTHQTRPGRRLMRTCTECHRPARGRTRATDECPHHTCRQCAVHCKLRELYRSGPGMTTCKCSHTRFTIIHAHRGEGQQA